MSVTPLRSSLRDKYPAGGGLDVAKAAGLIAGNIAAKTTNSVNLTNFLKLYAGFGGGIAWIPPSVAGAYYFSESVVVPDTVHLRGQGTLVNFGDNGNFIMLGSYELTGPVSGAAATTTGTAAADQAVINLTAGQGANFTNGDWLYLEGDVDACNVPLANQYQIARLASKSTDALTLGNNLGSSFAAGTRVTKLTKWTLSGNTAFHDKTFSVSSATGLAAGDICVIYDEGLTKSDLPCYWETVVIQNVNGTTITPTKPLATDFSTTRNAVLLRLASSNNAALNQRAVPKNCSIMGFRSNLYEAQTGNSHHIFRAYFTKDCVIDDVQILNEGTYKSAGHGVHFDVGIGGKIGSLCNFNPTDRLAAGEGYPYAGYRHTDLLIDAPRGCGGRHQPLLFMTARGVIRLGQGAGGSISAFDLHGGYERFTVIDGGVSLNARNDLNLDNNEAFGKVGNVEHRTPPTHTVIRNLVLGGFKAGGGGKRNFGLELVPPLYDLALENVTLKNGARAFRARFNSLFDGATAASDCAVISGNRYQSTAKNFYSLGLRVGDKLWMDGFVNAANNGVKTVTAIGTVSPYTFTVSETLTVESAPATVEAVYMDFIRDVRGKNISIDRMTEMSIEIDGYTNQAGTKTAGLIWDFKLEELSITRSGENGTSGYGHMRMSGFRGQVHIQGRLDNMSASLTNPQYGLLMDNAVNISGATDISANATSTTFNSVTTNFLRDGWQAGDLINCYGWATASGGATTNNGVREVTVATDTALTVGQNSLLMVTESAPAALYASFAKVDVDISVHRAEFGMKANGCINGDIKVKCEDLRYPAGGTGVGKCWDHGSGTNYGAKIFLDITGVANPALGGTGSPGNHISGRNAKPPARFSGAGTLSTGNGLAYAWRLCYFTGTNASDRVATLSNASADNEGIEYWICNANGANDVNVTTAGGTQTVVNATTIDVVQYAERKFKSVNDNGTYKYLGAP